MKQCETLKNQAVAKEDYDVAAKYKELFTKYESALKQFDAQINKIKTGTLDCSRKNWLISTICCFSIGSREDAARAKTS